MTNIKPRRLVVSGFRSFANQVEVDLPEKGLVLISGRNHDSTGPSGSGKSSLLEALAYAFDISQFPATEHQSWHTETPFQVEVELDTPVGTAVLRRGKVSSLKVGSAKAVSGASAMKNSLHSLIGLKPDMLRALTYRPQRERGLFLSMGDTAKKEFLTELLRLDRFEAEAERTQKEITKLDRDADVQASVLLKLMETLPPEPARPTPVDTTALVQEQTEKEFVYDDLRTKYAQAIKDLENVESKLREERRFVEAEYAQPINVPDSTPYRNKLSAVKDATAKATYDQLQALDKLNMARVSLNSLLGAARAAATDIPKLEAETDKIQEELRLLGAATCPTCKQNWATDEVARAVASKQATIAELNSKIDGLRKFETNIPELKAKLLELETQTEAKKLEDPAKELRELQDKLQEKIAQVEKEASKAQAEHRLRREQALGAVQADYQKLLDEKRQALALLATEVSRAKEEVTGVDFQIRQVNQTNVFKQEEYERALQAYQKAVQQKEQTQASVDLLQETVNQERDYLGAVGREGFLGLIFGDILDAISAETNEILAQVPNVAHVTLHFQTERETQDGKVRKEIKPVIRANGREISLRSGLSGGMQAAVELAVDIAVAKVVSERTGVFPGWLVLDEAFDGLGVVEKRGCMEVLAQAARDRLILVVDHASEIQELFDQVIMVECKGGISAIG